ncbi:hypothetical protein, conserved [Leishmania tarentolae]|uniref:Uncharacterized protein n=1 Tax=Leishmania tarentolae TaxID=5689 RepID=A0A640KBY9_LEITA|nr:hypothetical protein, conserved [Leishmania tarentolae]
MPIHLRISTSPPSLFFILFFAAFLGFGLFTFPQCPACSAVEATEPDSAPPPSPPPPLSLSDFPPPLPFPPMEASTHHNTAAIDTYVEASIPEDSSAAVNSRTLEPLAEIDYVTKRHDAAIDTQQSDAFWVSPPTVAQAPLPRLENGVATATPSAGAPVPTLCATATTNTVEWESSHPHMHLLHIIKQQQERIATLHASLEHAVRSVQRSSEALESLQGMPCAAARTGRIHARGVASPPLYPASAPSASIAEVTSAVSKAVRWADSVTSTPVRTSPVSCGSFTEWKDDLPQEECCSHILSSPSIAPAMLSPLPVVLLDITSMFRTRSTRAAAAHPELRRPSLSTNRQSSETQTDAVATEPTTPTGNDMGDSSGATRQLVDQLRGELADTQQRLQATEMSASSLRARMLALQQNVASGASCRAPVNTVSSCRDELGASSKADAVSGVDGLSCEGASPECLGHEELRKDMEELRRLRLLLRFSELKKDSDRLAEIESALQVSSAAQLRLKQRCDRLVHENAQRLDCLRAIASCIGTTLTAEGKGTSGNRTDAKAAHAAAPIKMPDSLANLLRYVLHLCTDAALSPGAHRAPLPLPHAFPPKDRQPSEQSRQNRLHKAVSESRDGGRSLPCRPPSRRASWQDPRSKAAVRLGEQRASKP